MGVNCNYIISNGLKTNKWWDEEKNKFWMRVHRNCIILKWMETNKWWRMKKPFQIFLLPSHPLHFHHEEQCLQEGGWRVHGGLTSSQLNGAVRLCEESSSASCPLTPYSATKFYQCRAPFLHWRPHSHRPSCCSGWRKIGPDLVFAWKCTHGQF